MHKAEFINRIVTMLRENDIKKPISIPKQSFTISDDEGHSKTFSVKKRDKSEAYTRNDVANIVDAELAIIKDLLRNGEALELVGIGSLGVHYRKPRMAKYVDGSDVFIAGRYVPRFKFGNELRMCARAYGMSLDEKVPEMEPLYSDDDFADDDEDAEDGEE